MNQDLRFKKFIETWQGPQGRLSWIAEVNNQPLGKRFMSTAFIFFFLGGILALLIRIQLAFSENNFMGPQVYNQIFTMHGSTMMYLFAVPFLEGLALYLLPLMIGSRDVAFPRLSSFSYWTYIFGGIVFYASFLFGTVPDAGWFAYTPLSGPKYTGLSLDFWVLGLGLVEIAGISTGIEILVTLLKFRAPGMSIQRMPLFAWAMMVTAFMIIFAFTTLLTATLMLEMDRTLGTRFFDPDRGGNTLLWQHLFWFFGHPEVYIMFIPATGIVSMVTSTFARRPILGHIYVVLAIIVTGFVSFGLWAHHMFASGLPELASSFFTAASLMIALASGTQVFAWIATLWGTRPAMRVPLLFVLGFLFLFVAGGLTGVMVAVVPFDLQVHDTYFVVAHFHYVLIGGVVFPIMAGLYYWFPKITGKMPHEKLGSLSFWLIFIGFNVTFFPMHIMGILGMPRRVYTYPSILKLDGYNLISSVGSALLAAGFLLFVFDFVQTLRKGASAKGDPWSSDSLEWSISSPPEVYGFLKPPVVSGKHPLWNFGEEKQVSSRLSDLSELLSAKPEAWRGTLATDAFSGEPQAIQYLPGPTFVPFWAALGLMVLSAGILTKLMILAAFGLLVFLASLVRWLWTSSDVLEKLAVTANEVKKSVQVFVSGSESTLWWGMLCFIAVIFVAFSALYFSYFYIWLYSSEWPQGELSLPSWIHSFLVFIPLLLGGVAHGISIRMLNKDDQSICARVGFGLSWILATLFAILFSREAYRFDPKLNAFASLHFTISSLFLIVLLIAIGIHLGFQFRIWMNQPVWRSTKELNKKLVSMYWYSTIGLGLSVWAVLYLSPQVL